MEYARIITTIIFLLILLLIGLLNSRSRRKADDYFVAGRSRRFWSVFFSLGATVIGGSATLGLCGLAAENGFSAAVWLWGGAAGLICAGFFVAGAVVGEKVYTVPEFLGMFYSRWISRSASLVIVTAWTGVIAAQLLAVGHVVSAIFFIPLSFSILITAAVLGFYVWLGGQHSVIKTDLLQFTVLLVGFCVLFGEIGQRVGAKRSMDLFSMEWTRLVSFPGTTGWNVFFLFLVIGVVFATGPDIFSRFLCSKDIKPARLAAWMAGTGLMPFSLLIAGLGILGGVLCPGIQGDALLPALVSGLDSGIIQGIVLTGILAAVLSSADTCVMTASTIMVMETSEISGTHQNVSVHKMKYAIPLIVSVSMVVAMLFPYILDVLLGGYLVYVAAVSPLLFPLLLKRKTPIDPGVAPWILGIGLVAGLVSIFTGYISIVGIWILGLLLIWGIVNYFR